MQFEKTLEGNIEKFAGPVTVDVSNVKSGSVVFDTTVAFLNGQNASASAYKAALTSNVQSIYGSTYGSMVTVNTSTIVDTTAPNPSKHLLCHA